MGTECGKDACTVGDLFIIAFFIKYPTKCLDSAWCRIKFHETVQRIIAMLHCKLILSIPIVGNSVLNMPLTFCEINEVLSGK
jgi:hypothetical protein